MTWVLVRKLLRDSRWALLIVCLLLGGYQMIWPKITQRIVTQFAPLMQVAAEAEGMPLKEKMREMFSGPGRVMQSMIGGEQLNFESAEDVLSIGYVHPLMQVIFCLWAIGRAAGAIAGEIDKGTMELLLAQPIRRHQIVLSHLAVDAIVIPLLSLSLWAGLAIGATIVGDIQPASPKPIETPALPFAKPAMPREVNPELLRMDVTKFGRPLINVAAFIFAVSGMTMRISAMGRSRWRTIGIATLIMLVQFAMNIIGQMWDTVGFLRPLSVFYYYQPQNIGLRGDWSITLEPLGLGIDVPVLLVLAGIGALGYAMALRTFQRRDLPAPL